MAQAGLLPAVLPASLAHPNSLVRSFPTYLEGAQKATDSGPVVCFQELIRPSFLLSLMTPMSSKVQIPPQFQAPICTEEFTTAFVVLRHLKKRL